MKAGKRKRETKDGSSKRPIARFGPLPISAQSSLSMRVEKQFQKMEAKKKSDALAVRRGPYISLALVFAGDKFQRVVEAPNIVMNKTGVLAITIKKQLFELFASSDYVWIDTNQSKLAKGTFAAVELQQAHLLRLPRPDRDLPSLESIVNATDDNALKARLQSLRVGLVRERKVKRQLDAAHSVKPLRRRDVPTFSAKNLAARIPGYDASQLLQIWKNALRLKTQSRNNMGWMAEIADVIDLIEHEWSTRDNLQSVGSFVWPTTDAPKASNSIGISEFGGDGMLSYLEYHVGRTHGLPFLERISILERVFEGKLPKVFAPSYMADWSDPKSPKRLQKMAECIAAFARNAKRRDDDRLDQAIREWEDDLGHLFTKYYVGHFHFAWPITAIV